MKVVITYDITNNKKRNKIASILESYGYRVNFSVFELDIKQNKLNNLIKKLKEYIKDNDSIRIYHFTNETVKKSIELNEKLNNPFELEDGYID